MRGRLGVALFAAAALAVGACSGDDGEDATPRPSESATAADATLTPQQIVERLSSSVVRIRATCPEGVGGGLGIVWEDARRILTNAHVVLGAGAI